MKSVEKMLIKQRPTEIAAKKPMWEQFHTSKSLGIPLLQNTYFQIDGLKHIQDFLQDLHFHQGTLSNQVVEKESFLVQHNPLHTFSNPLTCLEYSFSCYGLWYQLFWKPSIHSASKYCLQQIQVYTIHLKKCILLLKKTILKIFYMN